MFPPVRFAIGIGMLLYFSFITATAKEYPLLMINLVQLVGISFNAVAVMSNGMKMPVKLAKGETVWRKNTHTPMTPSTKFALLCDRFAFANRCFSIGDVYIITSITLLLFYLFCTYILL
jgi:hypothetical protein